MSFHKVALIGGGGRLGPSVLEALSQAQTFEVAVISRASSNAKYPASIKDVRVSDAMEHDELVTALQGQDVLIICIAGALSAPAIKFGNAALAAGVKRVIPADFGSCDSADAHSLSLLPLYREKKKVREHLEKLSAESGGSLTWTSLITGHFLDYGIQSGLMQIDMKAKTATHFDGGDIPWSATTLPDIGLATVRILQNPDVTKNKLLYIQSVLATQNQLLKAVETVTGESYKVKNLKSDEFIAEHSKKLETNPDDADATEELVSVEGIINGNWEERDSFANELLSLPNRDLEQIVRQALA